MNKKCSDCAAWQYDSYRGWHYCSQGQGDICPGNGKACNFFKQATVFQQITASPEVLAPYFVFATEDTVLSRHDERGILYFSSITGGYYQYRDNAIAATVAKLKEIANERD